ncbi:AzlC family ABC transporter permease [Paracoccus methylarcula]|uniref:Branched-chain amino acid transporter AzlC n=1 Tax=Paracoccus methylarcula TaxID=72022 RepID=A0A422QYG9_9RHOB|nr:AzlC family ABC transporter permease [Paracoccus methylarcula]RNF35011.1 branched-chain amino acid transporter AzlC [Paracoccus methylarcula]
MTAQRSAFLAGFRACAPFSLIIVPFSTLFGVVARDAGLDVLQVMAMAAIVIAGASQFTAIALLQDNAPVFIALLAALAVNLRMALYSAALQPHLGRARIGTRMLMSYLMIDQSYAVAARHFDMTPAMSLDEKVAYYMGCAMLCCPLWYGGCLAGALIGQRIPASLSLDFAIPICFISLIAPLMRTLPHIVAALVAVTAAILLSSLPGSFSLLISAIAAMIAGAQSELWLRRRARTVSE